MEYVLTFQKTNYSIQGEQLLLSHEIPVKVMPLPASIKAGCGLCLRISPDHWPKASQLLQEKQVPVEAVYQREVTEGLSQYSPIFN